MKNYKSKFKILSNFLSVVLIFAFLILNFSAVNAASLSVISVSPADGATNVQERPEISAYFNEDINPGSVNENTFKLENKFGTEIDGEVSYSVSEKKASFKLPGSLPYDNTYTATLTTGIKDLEGNNLSSSYVWKFTIGNPLPVSQPDGGGGGGGDSGGSAGTGGNINGGGDSGGGADSGIELKSEDETLKEKEGGAVGNIDEFSGSGIGKGGIVPCGMDLNNNGKLDDNEKCTICHLFIGIDRIIRFLSFDIAMPLAVVVIIYGGVMILTSAGSEDKIKKGRTALEMAIIGLVIVFAGWLIVDTILRVLMEGGTGNIKNWGPWNDIPTNC